MNPTFIDVNNVRPDRNSSFIRSKIKMLASTAMPTDKIAAETPDRVKVTGINLNTVIKKLAYRIRVIPAIKPGIR